VNVRARKVVTRRVILAGIHVGVGVIAMTPRPPIPFSVSAHRSVAGAARWCDAMAVRASPTQVFHRRATRRGRHGGLPSIATRTTAREHDRWRAVEYAVVALVIAFLCLLLFMMLHGVTNGWSANP